MSKLRKMFILYKELFREGFTNYEKLHIKCHTKVKYTEQKKIMERDTRFFFLILITLFKTINSYAITYRSVPIEWLSENDFYIQTQFLDNFQPFVKKLKPTNNKTNSKMELKTIQGIDEIQAEINRENYMNYGDADKNLERYYGKKPVDKIFEFIRANFDRRTEGELDNGMNLLNDRDETTRNFMHHRRRKARETGFGCV